MASDLVITISGDRRRLRRELDSADKDLGRFSDSTKSRMKAVGLAAAGAAASFGTAGLAFGIKKAIDEWRDAAKVTAQTEAVLKSTGNAANVTAGQVSRLAEKLSLVAGVDDEVIQRGVNMLLTFKNIRNEVGRNNDIFDQTVKVTLDMAAAMAAANNSEINLRTASIQVGKALNDPIRGMTALSRVGVTFSDSQRAVIERLVESGRKMDAQRLILRELRSEFGGSAKANADAMDRIGVAIDNIFEKFGKKLAPIVTEVATKLARFVIQMNSGRGAGGRFVKQLEEVARVLADVWKVIRFGINLLIDWNRLFLKLPKLWVDVAIAAVKAGKAIVEAVKGAFNVVKKAAGDAIAFVLRRFADMIEVAAKIPIIGDKFEGLARDINRAADRADRLGEEVRRLPKAKDIDVKVRFNPIGVDPFSPNLANPLGSGRPLGDFIDARSQRFMKRWAKKNPGKLSQLFGPSRFTGPLGARPTGTGDVDIFNRLASRFGLQITSGYRPGDDGWHGQDRARDYSNSTGPTPQMLAFAQYMARNFGGRLLELIYTPLGFSIKNGQRTPPYAQRDHYDHVHVAMQRGGTIPGMGSGDKVPVLAEPGEGFINKRAVAAMGGKRVINLINRMVPRFAEGGVVSAFNRAINRSGAKGTKAELALWMAGIVESGLRNLSYGDADSTGALQVRAGTAAGLGIDPMNPGQVAMAFLTRGFWGKGGALSLARNAKLSAGNIAQMVQGSAFPSRYDAVRAQAMRYMGRGAGRGRDGGGGGGGRDREDAQPRVPGFQRFTRAERREREQRRIAQTPVGGRTTTGAIGELRQDIGHERRWEALQGIREDEQITPREHTRATAAYMRRAAEINQRIKLKRDRLFQINQALRGRLRPATRRRLLEEKAQIIGDIGGLRSEKRSLETEYKGLVAPPDVGAADVGGEAGDGEDPNQPLIDAMNLHAEQLRALAEQQKALEAEVKRQNDINQSTVAIGLREAQRALADMISGQIAGIAGQRARSAGAGMVGATY